jgi:drug/metabolite transporter (DMT)-like permease
VTGVLNPTALGLIGFCIAAEIGREVCFKRAAEASEASETYAAMVARQPVLWLGLAFWAVEIVAWVMVLQTTRLSLAYPLMTLTYAGMPLAGRLLLKERLGRGQMLGAGLVALGVVCVGMSGL